MSNCQMLDGNLISQARRRSQTLVPREALPAVPTLLLLPQTQQGDRVHVGQRGGC